MSRKTKEEVTRQGSTGNSRLTIRFSSVEEREEVEQKAKACGFATEKQSGASGYMKSVVMGYNPPSVFDQKVMIEVCKLHAHLGKIGGLFKLAISEGGAGAEYSVYAGELLRTQKEVKELILDIKKGSFHKNAKF